MPTYEYRCKDCGQHLEVVQAFTDDPLEECPHCQGMLRKVFSPIGITFKGSGFYRTDSRAGSASKKAADGDSKSTESTTPGDKPAGDKAGRDKAGSDKAGTKDTTITASSTTSVSPPAKTA